MIEVGKEVKTVIFLNPYYKSFHCIYRWGDILIFQ